MEMYLAFSSDMATLYNVTSRHTSTYPYSEIDAAPTMDNYYKTT